MEQPLQKTAWQFLQLDSASSGTRGRGCHGHTGLRVVLVVDFLATAQPGKLPKVCQQVTDRQRDEGTLPHRWPWDHCAGKRTGPTRVWTSPFCPEMVHLQGWEAEHGFPVGQGVLGALQG